MDRAKQKDDRQGLEGPPKSNSYLPRHPHDDEVVSSRDGARQILVPKYDEGNIDVQRLDEVRRLLKEEDVESHREALRLLGGDGLLSFQRWEGVHNSESHNLSNPFRHQVNGLIKRLLSNNTLPEGATYCEMGTGMGVDLTYAADRVPGDVIGIDSSQSAIERVKARCSWELEEDAKKDRVKLVVANYIDWLKERDEQGESLDMIYMYSALHYYSPLVLRDEIFPLMARVLTPQSPLKEPGILAFSMKTARSASARADYQLRLTGGKYNPSVDLNDRMFRIYPKNQRAILDLVEPSFEQVHSHLARRRGYDVTGKTEYFFEYYGRPRV
ncbi:MAG: class I SAM-dependent methyltransferase [Candidatus Peregrinibacteria bacterium]|nr:class I SAM-dependent methyltransferase [Candidatus Peregrinibacteria bacterium]